MPALASRARGRRSGPRRRRRGATRPPRVVELEPGLVAAERQRRQPEVVLGQRRAAARSARPRSYESHPAHQPSSSRSRSHSPAVRDLARPHGQIGAAPERAEPGPALEQHQTGLVTQSQGGGERIRPRQRHCPMLPRVAAHPAAISTTPSQRHHDAGLRQPMRALVQDDGRECRRSSADRASPPPTRGSRAPSWPPPRTGRSRRCRACRPHQRRHVGAGAPARAGAGPAPRAAAGSPRSIAVDEHRPGDVGVAGPVHAEEEEAEAERRDHRQPGAPGAFAGEPSPPRPPRARPAPPRPAPAPARPPGARRAGLRSRCRPPPAPPRRRPRSAPPRPCSPPRAPR